MNNIVVIKNLTKRYNNQAVVNNISFEVKEGEIFGLIGPNGAGKTTTLEMIETLRSIDSGTIVLDGKDVNKVPQYIKEIIGVQPQMAGFQDKQKITEVIEMFAAAYSVKVNAQELLSLVGLEQSSDKYVEKLSGGQKQRLSIAVALVHSPKIFFLDEPTTGLDPQARRNLWELITKIRHQGVTIILTTHYLDEAEMLCDRIAIIDNGQIIALDSPHNLIKQLIKKGFKKKQHMEQANLEDVFIDLTGKAIRD